MLGSIQRLLYRLCDPLASADEDPPVTRTSGGALVDSLRKLAIHYHDPKPFKPFKPSTPSTACGRDLISTPNTFQLPHELMAEIFATVCHADSDKFLADKNRHTKTTPLTLGSVCSQWRDVVWYTPHIWSHLSLSLSSTSRYDTQIELLSSWLARSGVCPLTINLVLQDEDKWTERIPTNLIELLAANAHRWQSINFVLPEAWYPLLECTKDSYHLLTTVSTQPLWADCGLSPSKRKRLELFERAPLLNDLHLNGYYLSDVTLQWNQLTRFTLQHVYLDECFDALVKTPNLTWCRIYTILVNDVDRVVEPRLIELLALEKLIMYCATWGDTVRLIEQMRFPLLKVFMVTSPQDNIVLMDLPGLLFLANGANITGLALTEVKNVHEEGQFLAMLRQMPLLEDLDLEFLPDSIPFRWFFIDLLRPYRPLEQVNTSSTFMEIIEPVESGKPLVPAANSTYILPKLDQFAFSGPIAPYKPRNPNDKDSNINAATSSESFHRAVTAYNNGPDIVDHATQPLPFHPTNTDTADNGIASVPRPVCSVADENDERDPYAQSLKMMRFDEALLEVLGHRRRSASPELSPSPKPHAGGTSETEFEAHTHSSSDDRPHRLAVFELKTDSGDVPGLSSPSSEVIDGLRNLVNGGGEDPSTMSAGMRIKVHVAGEPWL